MKLTKTQLKQFIKEELKEQTTTQLNEDPVELMTDPQKIQVIVDAIMQVGYNFSPVAIGALMVAAGQRIMQKDPTASAAEEGEITEGLEDEEPAEPTELGSEKLGSSDARKATLAQGKAVAASGITDKERGTLRQLSVKLQAAATKGDIASGRPLALMKQLTAILDKM